MSARSKILLPHVQCMCGITAVTCVHGTLYINRVESVDMHMLVCRLYIITVYGKRDDFVQKFKTELLECAEHTLYDDTIASPIACSVLE